MLELPKHIELIWREGKTAVPLLPFISGKKKIELEAIAPKIVVESVAPGGLDSTLNNRILMQEPSEIDTIQITEENNKDMQLLKKIFQNAVETVKDEIAVAWVKAMISWNEIKDEELRAALGSDYNSDFWQEQDIRELGEKYTFFRRFIAKY